MTSRPSAAVFDNDGLLLDTEEAWTRAERTLFARREREFTDADKRILIGSSRSMAAVKLEALLDRPSQGEALMDELLELVMDEALQGVAPRPGALELIAQLSDAGVPLAVASNSEPQFVERVLSGAGLLDGGPFATVVTVADIEHPKPAPDIYLEACRRLGVAPTERRCARGLADRSRRGSRRRHVRDRRALLRRQRHTRREPARRQPRRPRRRARVRP